MESVGKRNMNFERKFEIRNRIWKILLCFVLLNATQQQSVANNNDGMGPPLSLQIEVGPEEKITPNQNFQTQVASLKQFYIRKVWPAFPSDLASLLMPYRLKLFLTSYCPSDGLFMDPEMMVELEQLNSDPGQTLWMCMKPDLFWGPDAYTLLAHEVFHAVHFLVHPNESPWIREGLAQWFEYRVTGNFNGANIRAALEHPETSLFGAYYPGKTNRNQYGHSLLYMYYLWSHCGGDSLIWDITRGYSETSKSASHGVFGENNIDDVLTYRRKKTESHPEECADFEKSAVSFEIARVHNKMSYDGAKASPYHLIATALQPVEPRQEIPKTIDGTDINSLRGYTPIFISGEAASKSVSSEKFHIFWLEKYFPYSVKTSRPEDFVPSRWNVLLLKK
jgi:hypothetical protein